MTAVTKSYRQGGQAGIQNPAHWGLGEIDGLLVPPGKASNLLVNRSSEPAQEKWFSQTIHRYKSYLASLVVISSSEPKAHKVSL